jgi:hypothetical protein
MEGITRLVSESLARHGFDRPPDYRRLHWSRWFRCESPHSLLLVPSKPGVFALAEEIMEVPTAHVATAARSAAPGLAVDSTGAVEDRAFGAASSDQIRAASVPEHRMLAVTQFFEDDDMAFTLDRMMARPNPMRQRLVSGRYFVRFVVIQDIGQRRSICSALNQWIANSSEKASGIGAHFASSLELAAVKACVEESSFEADSAGTARSAAVGAVTSGAKSPSDPDAPRPEALAGASLATDPNLDSGARSNVHCPSPFPSGF